MPTSRVIFILFFVVLLTSLSACSVFENPKHPRLHSNQGVLSEVLDQHYLENRHKFSEFVKNAEAQNPLHIADKLVGTQSLFNFLKKINKTQSVFGAIIETDKKGKLIDETRLSAALVLFPTEREFILDAIFNSEEYSYDDTLSSVLLAGLDPHLLVKATSASTTSNRVVPLINSFSMTFYDIPKYATNIVEYKKPDDQKWLRANKLQWDPMDSAYSGSIVYLESNTEYQVRVSLLLNGQLFDVRELSTTTRPDSPPINPSLVYYLEDIYTGGQLDLEVLNIKGEKDGWAKIIGDQTIIDGGNESFSAINVGNQSYVMFENITVRGGRKHGIYGKDAHNIWIKGCDIAQWGRVPSIYKNGRGYEDETHTYPINYDAGIYLKQTGSVVVEDCQIHSPNGKANNWSKGHPKGPTAMLISAKHKNKNYEGQYIIRNNRFFGTDEKRFNDVIEGTGNFRRNGGFLRDSAIYGNYLAFANDDIIELDGGQSNVLFYNNEVTQGYCGVSVAPNMKGPSYVFNNHIYDLGDDREKMWASIKMGGLREAPSGTTHVFNNKVLIYRNGIASAGVRKDPTFQVNAINNIFISTRYYRTNVGFAIIEKEGNAKSKFLNNVAYNTRTRDSVSRFSGALKHHKWSSDISKLEEFEDADSFEVLCVRPQHIIKNFTKLGDSSLGSVCEDGETPIIVGNN